MPKSVNEYGALHRRKDVPLVFGTEHDGYTKASHFISEQKNPEDWTLVTRSVFLDDWYAVRNE